MLADESLHALTLLKAVLTKYGAECADWDPVVIKKTLYDDFQAARVNVDKVLAGLSVLQHDKFWNDWQTFHFIAQAFNNTHPTGDTVQKLSVAQMMVAVDTADMIRQSLQSVSYVPVFSGEVAKFIAAQALDEGIWYLPEPLEFANCYSSKTVIHCNDCFNEEYLDDQEDVYCGVCTRKYDTTSLLEFAHNDKRLEKGFGKNTTIVVKNPILNVRTILDQLLEGGPDSVTVNEEDADFVCAARLYVALLYREKRLQEAKR